jgi:hypothetical protein
MLMVTVLTIPAYATEEAVTELSTTEVIVEWVKTHIEEISVIGSLIVYAFYEIKKHGKLNISMGILNNNAIEIAKSNSDTVKAALEQMADLALKVEGYKNEFTTIIEESRKTVEEKQGLEATLSHVENFLRTSKLATIELSNEVAELLVLANIPNSKKDELYARHMKAVHELEAVEQEEVTSNDRTEV